jgi:glutaredoxin-like YruB-family protein
MVLVYTTPTCPHCKSAKRYLRERQIPFREVDVTRSADAAANLKRRSGQTGVPVIDVNGQIIVGFNRPKLDRALGIRSLE